MLGNTQVFAAAAISFFVFKERLTPAFITAAAIAFLGVALLVGVGSEQVIFAGDYARGIVFGLVTGLAYAAFVVCLKQGQRVAPGIDPVVFVAWNSLYSALLLGIVAWIEGSHFVPHSSAGVLSLAGLAVLVQSIGWLAISSALPRVVTARAGLVLLLQPILAMVWGVILFAEYLTPLQILGALVTLIAMYVGTTRRQFGARRNTSRPGVSGDLTVG